jgi:hypothetical protein
MIAIEPSSEQGRHPFGIREPARISEVSIYLYLTDGEQFESMVLNGYVVSNPSKIVDVKSSFFKIQTPGYFALSRRLGQCRSQGC